MNHMFDFYSNPCNYLSFSCFNETELIQYLEHTIAAGDKGYLLGETFMQSTFSDPVTGRRGKGRQVLQ